MFFIYHDLNHTLTAFRNILIKGGKSLYFNGQSQTRTVTLIYDNSKCRFTSPIPQLQPGSKKTSSLLAISFGDTNINSDLTHAASSQTFLDVTDRSSLL